MRRFCMLAMVFAGLIQSSNATELIKDGKAVELEKGALISPSVTFSGYPIYGGDGGWKFVRSSAGQSNSTGGADSVGLVSLDLEQVEPDGSWFAIMLTRVNSSNSATNGYWTGAPCKGDFTYAIDKGAGRDDNCQTLKAVGYKAGTSDKVFLSLMFTHGASGGRRLTMELRLNPELLGFRLTNPSSWSAEAVAQNPAKKKFIERLKDFGSKLQAANQVALGFSKPKDAYAGVPSYRTLLDVPEDLADGSFSQQFIGAVEHEKNAPDFKAIAYSKWGGNRISWSFVDEQESQSVADSRALENCNKGKRVEGTPCVLYDLKTLKSSVGASSRSGLEPASPHQTPKATAKTVEARLTELKGLVDKALISQQEFNKRREEILKDL